MGDILVAVNPFKALKIYEQNVSCHTSHFRNVYSLDVVTILRDSMPA